jgi:hypothetical protein
VRRLALALAVLPLAACGADARPLTSPRVQLKLSAPGDGRSLRAASVSVSGTVHPAGSAVTVSGQAATVSGATFSATIPLQPGGNVIDVTATAPGRRPASDALRVELPRLAGHGRDEAFARLQGLGLKPAEKRDDSWIDRLLPGDDIVCAIHPSAGALVDPGSRVTVDVSRNC